MATRIEEFKLEMVLRLSSAEDEERQDPAQWDWQTLLGLGPFEEVAGVEVGEAVAVTPEVAQRLLSGWSL